jgi:glycosyltransferase involved in cell wall biosynthesis
MSIPSERNDTVLILGQHFHPEITGPAQRLTELAMDLQRLGMRVTVITAQPSYFPGPKLPRREVYEGVEIVRLWLPYFRRDKRSGRITSAILFLALTLAHLMFSKRRGPFLIVTEPPILPLIGLILNRLRGQPYLCLVHDIYPQIAVRLGYLRKHSLVVKIWERLNYCVYKAADSVIVLSQCMAKTIEHQMQIYRLHPKVHVIHNWADSDTIVPRPKERNWMSVRCGLVGKLAVVYSGNIGRYHDFTTLLDAARLVRDQDSIRFLFIGDGGNRRRVLETVNRWNLPNVRLLPYQPLEDLPYTLTCGDLAAVTLARGAEGLCMPGKLYTALAAGQAILAITGKDSQLAAIVEEHRCGFRVDQGDSVGIVETLQRCLANPELLEQTKRNARHCFETLFTRQQAVQKYYEILSCVRLTNTNALRNLT